MPITTSILATSPTNYATPKSRSSGLSSNSDTPMQDTQADDTSCCSASSPMYPRNSSLCSWNRRVSMVTHKRRHVRSKCTPACYNTIESNRRTNSGGRASNTAAKPLATAACTSSRYDRNSSYCSRATSDTTPIVAPSRPPPPCATAGPNAAWTLASSASKTAGSMSVANALYSTWFLVRSYVISVTTSCMSLTSWAVDMRRSKVGGREGRREGPRASRLRCVSARKRPRTVGWVRKDAARWNASWYEEWINDPINNTSLERVSMCSVQIKYLNFKLDCDKLFKPKLVITYAVYYLMCNMTCQGCNGM